MSITKREYTKQMTDLTTRKNITASYIQKIIDNIELLNRPLTEDETAKLNRPHDQVAGLEQADQGPELAVGYPQVDAHRLLSP